MLIKSQGTVTNTFWLEKRLAEMLQPSPPQGDARQAPLGLKRLVSWSPGSL